MADTFGPAIREVGSDTATTSTTAASASNVTLFNANKSRRGASIFNDSSSALYIKYGATASTTSYKVKILGNQLWEMEQPLYYGQIDGIWDSATGNARKTEW